MIAAVVPAYNESGRISKVLSIISSLNPDVIIVVVNGCKDHTLGEIKLTKQPRLRVIHFEEPLGIDVPRAVGAKYALDLGATAVLFVDGDMIGVPAVELRQLVEAVEQGTDMALTNCYPGSTHRYSFANHVLYFREHLNKATGLFIRLGLSSPSHGPHAVSGNFLKQVPLRELAVPPVALALAARAGLVVQVSAVIPHLRLSSTIRDDAHSKAVGDTLIGDCLEAICVWKSEARCRSWGGKEYLGYHTYRRFDLLAETIAGRWPASARIICLDTI